MSLGNAVHDMGSSLLLIHIDFPKKGPMSRLLRSTIFDAWYYVPKCRRRLKEIGEALRFGRSSTVGSIVERMKFQIGSDERLKKIKLTISY